MSINMDRSDVSYHDHYHQHMDFRFNNDSAASQSQAGAVQNASVLEDRGGLDHDEVAELVYARFQPTCAPDGQDETDQSFANTFEYRGVAGFNLGEQEQLNVSTNVGNTNLFFIENSVEGDFTTPIRSNTDSGIIYHWDVYGSAGGIDTVAGGGLGGDTSEGASTEIMFQDIYGTGPVLDATDDISVVSSVLNDETVAEVENGLRCTFSWRVHQIESARPQYGLD